MDIDDLIRIALFVLFFVVPIVQSIAQRQQKNRSKPVKPQTNQPTTQAGQRQTRQQRPAAQPTTASGDFSRRLEEARKRVQSAMEAQTKKPQTVGSESATELFEPHQQSPIFEHEAPQVVKVAASFLPSESETSYTGLSVSEALQVQRKTSKKRAKLEPGLLELDGKAILSGIIWHQILSEPRAKRFRRDLSRRP